LEIEPLVREDFVRAVEIVEDAGLGFEDSLHLAVVLKEGVKEIVSSDGDFDKAGVKRVF